MILPPPLTGPIGRSLTEDEWVWLHDITKPVQQPMGHIWTTGPSDAMVDAIHVEVIRPDGQSATWTYRSPLVNKLADAIGFRFEHFGYLVGRPPQANAPWPFHRLTPPDELISLRTPVGFKAYTWLKVKLAYGWMDGSPIHALMQWQEEWPAEIWTTSGYSHPASSAEHSAARRALDYLQLKTRGTGGRRQGWRKGRKASREDILDWYQGYIFEPTPPTLNDLGEFLKVSPETARARLDEFEPSIPWPPDQHLSIWCPDDY